MSTECTQSPVLDKTLLTRFDAKLARDMVDLDNAITDLRWRLNLRSPSTGSITDAEFERCLAVTIRQIRDVADTLELYKKHSKSFGWLLRATKS